MRSSKIRELVGTTTGGSVLSLAGGLPPVEAFPTARIAEAVARILSGPQAHRALQYTPTEGDPRLLNLLESDLVERLGIPSPGGRILVTSGSQQALDLVAKVLLDPGDVVFVESPGYVGALRAFAAYQPEIVGVPVDMDGMDTAVLADLLAQGLRPKICYLVPNFSNPTGTTLSATRRDHLAELAAKYGFLVVEDDPYGELRFAGEHIVPIASHGAQVIYLGSFSKLIAPGLRVGYAVLPRWLFRTVSLAKQASDLNSAALSQQVVCELLESPGWFRSHIEMLRHLYRQRSRALEEAVVTQLDGRMVVSRPDGGMFAWASIIEDDFDALVLAQAAMARGVALVPADEFTVTERFPKALRLSFSMLAPHQFSDAISRIAQAFDDLST